MRTILQKLISSIEHIKSVNTIPELKIAKEKAQEILSGIDKSATSCKEFTAQCNMDCVLVAYSDTTWANELKGLLAISSINEGQKNKIKHHLTTLIEITTIQRHIEIEKAEDLAKEIRRAKNIAQLKRLKIGTVKNEVKIPSFEERVKFIEEDTVNKKNNRKSDGSLTQSLNLIYQNKLALLHKKKFADILSILLTTVIAVGVGFIGGVAIMLILPTMGLAAFIPTFIFFAIAAGVTEGLVYHPYNKKFCRGILANGFFEKIENNVLKREAKKLNLLDRHDLTKKQKKNRLIRYRNEIKFKKICAFLAGIIAILAGIGFTALVFSHIVAFMTLIGVTGGVVIPAFFAVAIGLSYAFVMYSMLYKAIKNDSFIKIKKSIVDLFSIENWANLSSGKKAQHLFTFLIKITALALILAISIAATVFTAGAWLSSSVGFFHTAIGLTIPVADKIAKAITAVMLVTTLGFNIENSLATAKTFAQIHWHKLSHTILHLFKHPGKLVGALLNFIPFIIHVAATGAIAVQGATTNFFEKIFAGLVGTSSEILVDLHAVVESDENHANHCHDHNHDVTGTIGKAIKKIADAWFSIHNHTNDNCHAKVFIKRQADYSVINDKLGRAPENKTFENKPSTSVFVEKDTLVKYQIYTNPISRFEFIPTPSEETIYRSSSKKIEVK
jgi:hypothetical protein